MAWRGSRLPWSDMDFTGILFCGYAIDVPSGTTSIRTSTRKGLVTLDIKVHVLRIEGTVNKTFHIIPQLTFAGKGMEAQEELEELVKSELRRDREENLSGPLVPDRNPTESALKPQYFYQPTQNRQALYKHGFPVRMGTYSIIDAFSCMGSRFGLSGLSVFVELCRSNMGDKRLWANVYYVADSELPACIIRVETWDCPMSRELLAEKIEEETLFEAQLKEQFEKLQAKWQDEPVKVS